MRLCLDQHYAPRIAAALRERGHDVIAAEAEGELRGLPDEELLTFCVRERRALVEHPDYYKLREYLIEFLEVRAHRKGKAIRSEDTEINAENSPEQALANAG